MATLAEKRLRTKSIVELYQVLGGDLSVTIKHLKNLSTSHITVRSGIKRLIDTQTTEFRPDSWSTQNRKSVKVNYDLGMVFRKFFANCLRASGLPQLCSGDTK